jgi:peptidoglycan/LPS O-acetylase OafA/YrhL
VVACSRGALLHFPPASNGFVCKECLATAHDRYRVHHPLPCRPSLAHPSCAVARIFYYSNLLCLGHTDRLYYLRLPDGAFDQPAAGFTSFQKLSLLQWALFSIGIGFLLLSLIYRNPVFRETFRYSLEGIAIFPVFYFAILFHDNALFRHLNSVWAIRIGTYSYAIYLIHEVILFAIFKNALFVANNSFVVFPVALMISIAFAATIDSFVDPYFKQLRHKCRSGKRSSIPLGPDVRKSPAIAN